MFRLQLFIDLPLMPADAKSKYTFPSPSSLVVFSHTKDGHPANRCMPTELRQVSKRKHSVSPASYSSSNEESTVEVGLSSGKKPQIQPCRHTQGPKASSKKVARPVQKRKHSAASSSFDGHDEDSAPEAIQKPQKRARQPSAKDTNNGPKTTRPSLDDPWDWNEMVQWQSSGQKSIVLPEDMSAILQECKNLTMGTQDRCYVCSSANSVSLGTLCGSASAPLTSTASFLEIIYGIS